MGDRIGQDGGVLNTIRSTVSTNLGSGVLIDPGPPTHDPYIFIPDVQLGLHVGDVSISVPCHWSSSPFLNCLVRLQWERICLVLLGLKYGGTQWRLSLL